MHCKQSISIALNIIVALQFMQIAQLIIIRIAGSWRH